MASQAVNIAATKPTRDTRTNQTMDDKRQLFELKTTNTSSFKMKPKKVHRLKRRKPENKFKSSSLPELNHFDEKKYGITTALLTFPKPPSDLETDYSKKIQQIMLDVDDMDSEDDYLGYDSDHDYLPFEFDLGSPDVSEKLPWLDWPETEQQSESSLDGDSAVSIS